VTFKKLRNSAAFAALAALTLLTSCTRPTRDQSVLKAVKAESQILMATRPNRTYAVIPKSRWPRVIASLKPEAVTVLPDGVDIMTKPYFDGGWGYFVPKSEGAPPKPAGRFSDLGQGVYSYHPY
jgi:hypothetical protein